MSSEPKVLGVMKPTGGGDEIPLLENELVVGRRPSCDIVLAFSNVSGKHCMLRLVNSIWHVRDLGSTNGTSINGQQLTSEHSLMPDDELGIATHHFMIEYEPGGPEAVLHKREVLEEEVSERRPRRSLMELAGIDTDDDKPRHRTGPPQTAPEGIECPSADFEDVLPEDVEEALNPVIETSDDDFLKLIEEDV
ncbi:MAG TPA: FHA domain-containing protein, partial [Isosphaeraceae bacterium]|nr:FHA domain-containing protein [Isosphaeraceae bacterium]